MSPTSRQEEVQDISWKQYLEELSGGDDSEPEGATVAAAQDSEDSGEDSDELPSAANADRHKRDMDMLMRHQAHHAAKKTVPQKDTSADTKAAVAAQSKAPAAAKISEVESVQPQPAKPATAAKAEATQDHEQEEEEDEDTDAMSNKNQEMDPEVSSMTMSPSSGSKKKPTILGRIFGSNNKVGGAGVLPGGSMLNEDITAHDDAWYGQHLARLGKDGVPCTKIATNGKPYERRVLIDSRNLIVEVRGGRTGSTGILLDDLVDLRRGLRSPEFDLFCGRIKKDCPSSELAERALVLQTPHRTFSFLLPSPTHRSNLAFCVLFLLKSKNRGVMASGSNTANSQYSTRAPKNGQGSIVYANRSTYEGQFQNYMRHGRGTLTLSDGTRYQSEWRNDERHGPGKEFCPDGTTFSGSYLNGMRHGHGVMTWPEGSKYSGQFERGRANGEGELLRTDGSVYRGHFHEDCMSGDGRMQWRDGVEYTGQFVGNRREGFGKMLWTSGKWKSYEGHWKDIRTLHDHLLATHH